MNLRLFDVAGVVDHEAWPADLVERRAVELDPLAVIGDDVQASLRGDLQRSCLRQEVAHLLERVHGPILDHAFVRDRRVRSRLRKGGAALDCGISAGRGLGRAALG